MSRVYIPSSLRQLVLKRAQSRCEYCLLHQDDTPFTHQVDHLVALKHGGQTAAGNLALACLECNRYKGSDLAAIDPNSGEITLVFNPRLHTWTEHFVLEGPRIIGQTSIGRATVRLLRLNDRKRVIQRQILIEAGRYPFLS
jgi:hypothetical protein